jgi:thiamine biosynthesis lipoprotein
VTHPADLPDLTVAPADVTPAPEQPRRAWVEQIMGMPVSFHVRGPRARLDGSEAASAVRRGIADLHRTEEIFSLYRAGSQINQLRRGELTAAEGDRWVREVIDLCDQAREQTRGAFDANLPDADGVRRFNPTGLVKGWAVERVTHALWTELPDHDVLVNAGGDIAVRCHRTDTPDWVLGIEDPADRGRVLATVPLRTEAWRRRDGGPRRHLSTRDRAPGYRAAVGHCHRAQPVVGRCPCHGRVRAGRGLRRSFEPPHWPPEFRGVRRRPTRTISPTSV